MGYFVNINSETTRTYEAVSNKDAFKNFLAFAYGLKFQKLNYLNDGLYREIYFDTPAHLLNSSGIVLSKIEEDNNAFFKVENTTFLSNVLKKMEKKIFVHQVGANDKLADHAFYVKDGITSLFSTAFSIDLENVISQAEPKMEVTIKSQIYELISGTGMRAKIALENKTVNNFETKRKYSVQGLTVKLDSNPVLYLNDFEEFNKLILKNCKQFLEVNENQFDFATKVTKPIVVVKKTKEQKKEEKAKKKKQNKF